MDAEIRDLLRTSLAALLADESSDRRRPLIERLDELGWAEVVADDRAGAYDLLFRAVGETLSRDDALSAVITDALATTSVAGALGIDELRRATVILPGGGHPDQPTSRAGVTDLEVRGIALGGLAPGSTVVVPAAGPDGLELAVAVLPGAALLGAGVPGAALLGAGVPGAAVIERVHGVDPDLGVQRVSFAVPRSDVRISGGPVAEAAWTRAVAAGRRGVAAALVAMGSHCVRQVVTYTGDRKQYGRSIASFQAVQHRLADAHAGLVGADGLVGESVAAASGTDGDPWVALVAKCAAGRAFEEASRQVQQCYGAIGFTWEHEFPGYLRRRLPVRSAAR